MPPPPAIKRELEVAFSKHSQPVWFRIVKYILIGSFCYFLWGTQLLWNILNSTLAMCTAMHFWFRYKIAGWTKSHGM